MSPDPAPTARAYSAQDRELQDEITAWERSLEAARDDAEVQAILGPVGFGPDALDALLVLVADAQTGYNHRATAMGVETDAGDAKTLQDRNARKAYGLFRDLARARFKGDEAAHDALSLHGEIPRAFNAFITHARGAYTNASAAPYTERLSVRGYTPERLARDLETLDILVDAAKTATSARKGAKKSTETRDAAARLARTAFAEYRDTARPLLGDLAERIGL